MRIIKSILAAVVILCAAGAGGCSAFRINDAAAHLDHAEGTLPQQFTGTFRWDETDEIQRIIINIYNVKTVSGIITATGKGTYNTSGVVTIINVRISINTATGFFEMWESDPDRDNGFVTEGSHTGAISPDYSRIEAVWTTAGTGTRGKLELTASGTEN